MKISFISGICVEYDAISNAIVEEMEALRDAGICDLRLFSYHCTRRLPFICVGNPADILLNPHFQASDLVIFHFGIYYPLFNLLPIVPRSAKRLVVFHNITPRDLVPPESQGVIDKSFAQMSNIGMADYVACVSMINFKLLREAGISTNAGILPLSVRIPVPAPKRKPSFEDKRTRIVFVGRLVRSKGPNELLEAVSKVLALDPSGALDIDLIGNLTFSDKKMIGQINAFSEELQKSYPGRIQIEVHGNATDIQKQEFLRAADIFVLPTRHEGFCIPILEAFACGCRVIVYENSNTPFISGGLARLVSTGDVNALADAIYDEMGMVRSSRWQAGLGPDSYRRFIQQTAEYVAQFSPNITGDRFVRLIKSWIEEGNIPPDYFVNTGSDSIRLPVKNVSVVSPSYQMEHPQWMEMLSHFVLLGESEPCLGEGWYAPENWPPRLRHFGKHARIYLQKPVNQDAQLRLRTFLSNDTPDKEPVQLTISLWGQKIGRQSLQLGIWEDLFFPLPELPQYPFLSLELSVNKTWIPDRIYKDGDLRELGLAVHSIGIEAKKP
jgi:glycosyltransferase involved in cell wall biosynthesis